MKKTRLMPLLFAVAWLALPVAAVYVHTALVQPSTVQALDSSDSQTHPAVTSAKKRKVERPVTL